MRTVTTFYNNCAGIFAGNIAYFFFIFILFFYLYLLTPNAEKTWAKGRRFAH